MSVNEKPSGTAAPGVTSPAPASTPASPATPPTPAAPDPPPAKTFNASKTILLILLGIAIVVTAVRFVGNWSWSQGHEWTDDAQVQVDQVTITSKITERLDRLLFDTNQQVRRGQLLIVLNDVDERTRLAQAIAQRDAQEANARTAHVNVGLVSSVQVAQNGQNEGSIAEAKAAITTAEFDRQTADRLRASSRLAIATARSQWLALQETVPGARAQDQKAQNDLIRAMALRKQDDLAQSQLDQYVAAATLANSEFRSAVSNEDGAYATMIASEQRYRSEIAVVSSAGSHIAEQRGALGTAFGHLAESDSPFRVPNAQAEADAADRQVSALDTQIRSAREQLGYTRIVSPVDGFVGLKEVEIGSTVAPGQALMTIIPIHGVYITANFRETQIGRMRVGLPVELYVDAYPHHAFRGHVEYLGPAADSAYTSISPENANGNFVKITQRLPIRILVDRGIDSHYQLRPGMSVETTVDLTP